MVGVGIREMGAEGLILGVAESVRIGVFPAPSESQAEETGT